MKKIALFIGLTAFLLWSCNESHSDTSQVQQSNSLTIAGLQVQLEANPEWQYENLRLYPVCADNSSSQTDTNLPVLTSLAEGMNVDGFRITERKQFGRARDTWYNALTVQNKSPKTIFLMSGDVVTGGNQDRVIAYDDVIPPGTIKNIDVFCVEAGRSSYYNPEAPESEKQIAAFRGYYNVASPQVRQAVHLGNQQGVWNAVEAVTQANNATSATKTYAALETENEQKSRREAYQHFFEGKFSNLPNVVGVVAVCKGGVIGIDIFRQSELFHQQYPALVHGYITEAATGQTNSSTGQKTIEKTFKKVARLANAAPAENDPAGKFSIADTWLHLYLK